VGSKENALDVAAKIKRVQQHDERYGYEYHMDLADPAIFSKIGASQSIGQIFRGAGVRWQPAWNGPGSRVNGAQMIVSLLAEGRLKFFKTCTNCIRTIPQLPPSDFNPEDVDTDAEDHCWDSLRYGVMRRRRNPNKDDTESFTPESKAEVRDGSITFDPDDF